MPFAYKRGTNPTDENSYYSCSYCDLELLEELVGFVAAGPTYANGEFAKCPRCGEENYVKRVTTQEE